MAKTSIVYYTDSALDERLADFCRKKLLDASCGKPIISVSQKQLDFGENVCVGDIGRSHLSLFKQILIGVEKVSTEYVALAEHDCLYAPEHFDWIPPKDDVFFYNVNQWFVDFNTGMYSYQRRKVLSMMIANTELTLKAAKDKVSMLEIGSKIKKGQPGACEFGVCDNRVAFVDFLASMKDFGKEIGSYRAEGFRTSNPNLDIRHGQNFSGNRRARNRCYTIPFWGNFKENVWTKN